MKKVLVTVPVTEEDKQAFAAAASDCEIQFKDQNLLTCEDVADKEIILGNIPLSLVPAAKELKFLQLNNAGTDGYCDGILPEGCILANASGTYGLAISEHIVGMLLGILKKLYIYYDDQKAGLWKDEGHVRSIYGSNVLILGYGDIGDKTARLLHAFGAKIKAVRRTVTNKPDYIESLHTTAETDSLLPWADIILLAMPGTAETKGFIGRERLALMKSSAIILNVGRGILIDSDALAEALNSGRIAGAALDVTNPEPLPKGHALYTAKNAYITPHVSGQYHLPQTLRLIIELFLRNIRAYLAGEALESVVDFKTGYRVPSK